MNISSVFLRVCLTVLFLTRVNGLSNGGHDSEKEGSSKRYLMTHSGNAAWLSWRQRVACMTTCVHGYEAETVACCTTGDNRLCLNLPFATLNNSVGSCPDFCQRRSAITCSGSTAVCGSDGVTYSNMCELSKATCDNSVLKAITTGQCRQSTTIKPTMDPIQKVFCDNKDAVTCPTDLDLICSSDKQLFLNKCEFSKAVCDDLTLTSKDMSFCRN